MRFPSSWRLDQPIAFTRFANGCRWWTPPDAFDSISVWRGEDSENGKAFLIEVAAFRGKLTDYRKTTEDQSIPVRYEYRERTPVPLIYGVLLIFGAFVAWGNVRAGRVEQSGTIRLATYVFVIHLVVLFGYRRWFAHGLLLGRQQATETPRTEQIIETEETPIGRRDSEANIFNYGAIGEILLVPIFREPTAL